MPIRVTCACSTVLEARDDMAGTSLDCPKCNQPVQIPGKDAGDTVILNEVPAPAAASNANQLVRVELAQDEVVARREPLDEGARLARFVKGSRFFLVQNAETVPGWIPIQTITLKPGFIPEGTRTIAAPVDDGEGDDHGAFAAERAGINKGVIGGIVMIAIAVIWFVLGFVAGYIFIYPPILFVIGLYALIKGLLTRNIRGSKS